MISASHQFRCVNLEDTKISLFTTSRPAIEKVKKFKLSCFCFGYTELLGIYHILIYSDLFTRAGLSVWDNHWSEYDEFSSENQGISYFQVFEDMEFLKSFKNALADQEIRIDQYFPVPFTYGLSQKITPDHKVSIIINTLAYDNTVQRVNDPSTKNIRIMR